MVIRLSRCNLKEGLSCYGLNDIMMIEFVADPLAASHSVLALSSTFLSRVVSRTETRFLLISLATISLLPATATPDKSHQVLSHDSRQGSRPAGPVSSLALSDLHPRFLSNATAAHRWRLQSV